MENEFVKVYVGRRSMCAGDDMNVPNMATLYLTDNLDEFIVRMNKILPFSEWQCYLGYCEKSSTDEDGIMVSQKMGQQLLISVSYDNSITTHTNEQLIVKYDNTWYERIKKHPYLFCE